MTEDAALRALHELVGAGGWRRIPGLPNAVIVMRPWPDGSVDTLAVHGVTESLAERTNPIGHLVWRRAGEPSEVIAQLTRSRRLSIPTRPGWCCRMIRPTAPYDCLSIQDTTAFGKGGNEVANGALPLRQTKSNGSWCAFSGDRGRRGSVGQR
jgi:hypothetical protein